MAGRALLPLPAWPQWLRSLGQGEGALQAHRQAARPRGLREGCCTRGLASAPQRHGPVPQQPATPEPGERPVRQAAPPRPPGPTHKGRSGLRAHSSPRTGAGRVWETRSCQETPGARAPDQGSRSPSEDSPAGRPPRPRNAENTHPEPDPRTSPVVTCHTPQVDPLHADAHVWRWLGRSCFTRRPFRTALH